MGKQQNEDWQRNDRTICNLVSTDMIFLWITINIAKVRTEIFRENSKIPRVKTAIQENRRWCWNVFRTQENSLAKQIHEDKVLSKRRKGRPKWPWNDEVETIAEMPKIKWEETGNPTKDRKELKSTWKRNLPKKFQPYLVESSSIKCASKFFTSTKDFCCQLDFIPVLEVIGVKHLQGYVSGFILFKTECALSFALFHVCNSKNLESKTVPY